MVRMGFVRIVPAMLLGLAAIADTGDDADLPVVAKYLSGQEFQRQAMKGVEMDVEIEAAIPRLEKRGKMRALRVISKLGRITYDALRFDGDNTVKKDVIARYLATETQAAENPDQRLGITPANYKFKFKGEHSRDARMVYIVELTPKRKEVGLFKGEIWLDTQTCLPVREAGRFVKSPSVFLKRVEFVREFQIRDGVAVPTKIASFADTRIVGRTELNINYSNFHRLDSPIAEGGNGPQE